MNYNLTDFHSHILPGVDDGPSTVEEAAAMLKSAYRQGVTAMIATPHYEAGRYELPVGIVRKQFEVLKLAVKSLLPGMELYLGSEIYFNQKVPELLRADRLLTISGSSYVLVEFSPEDDFSYLRRSMNDLILAGAVPVLAHAERYRCLTDSIRYTQELVDMGVCIQVNAGSVIGESGRRSMKYGKALMKRQLVHFIGSDCHGLKHRPPNMEKCFRYICRKYGADYAYLLCRDNADRVLNDEYVY